MKVARWLLAGTLLGLCGFVLFYFRPSHQVPSLNTGLEGCWEVEPGKDASTLLCTLDPRDPPAQQRIQVLLRETTDSILSVRCTGCVAARCGAASGAAAQTPGDTQCQEITPGPAPAQQVRFELTAHGKTLGEQTILLALHPLTDVDKMQQRWRVTNGDRAQLRALLPAAQALADKLPTGELRDRAQLLVAFIHDDLQLALRGPHDTSNDPEAKQVESQLAAALQVALGRKWYRSAADLSLALTWFYRYREGAVEKIAPLLDHTPWLALLPAQRIGCYRLQLGAALPHQELRGLLGLEAEVRTDANALGKSLLGATHDLLVQQMGALSMSGSHPDVAAGLGQLQAAALATDNPCDQAYLFGAIGWIQLRLQELGWPGAEDPLPALNKAKDLRATACREQDADAVANVWINIARAHSASCWRQTDMDAKNRDAASAASKQALVQMRAALGKTPVPDRLRADLLLVEARLQLLDKKPEQALATIDKLLNLPGGLYPYLRWLGTAHKAEAQQAAGQLAEALASFRQAEAQLVSMQARVPIYQSHRLMFERYEYSSQRAVALALRLQRPAEALEIIRQSSQRALGLTMTPWWQEAPETLQPSWEQRRKDEADYLKRRLDYESRLAIAGGMTATQCKELGAEKTRWLSCLDEVYRHPTPAVFPPPALPPADLFLGCAQQTGSWVCVGASGGDIQVVPIPRPALDQAAVEQVLLPALAPRIQRAAKIRVLAHGALAKLELAKMRFSDRALGTIKPIRYTVDRPAPPPLPARHQALVVIAPEDNITGLNLDTAYRLLAPALAGLTVTARSATADFSAPSTWHRGEASSTDVMTDLPQSDSFVFFGHVDPMPCKTATSRCPDAQHDALAPDPRLTAMCLTQNTALWAGDLLVASRVPRQAFLIGCTSADRSSKSPTEMLGLALALALRGSQVLATTRPMRADQAEEVLCALGLQRLADPRFDMDQFVMDTQSHLSRGELCAARGKWYTPECPSGKCPQVDWPALRSYGP